MTNQYKFPHFCQKSNRFLCSCWCWKLRVCLCILNNKFSASLYNVPISRLQCKILFICNENKIYEWYHIFVIYSDRLFHAFLFYRMTPNVIIINKFFLGSLTVLIKWTLINIKSLLYIFFYTILLYIFFIIMKFWKNPTNNSKYTTKCLNLKLFGV